jgi:hypothetical protein
MSNEHELRQRLAQGWTAMTFCAIAGFLMDLVKSAVYNDFTKWANDPGPIGLNIVSTVVAIYIFMPVLIRTVSATWFRWTLMGLTAFFGLFFLAHQIAHAMTNSRPFDIIHIFDFCHHLLAIWMVVLASRWARLAPNGGMPSKPLAMSAR